MRHSRIVIVGGGYVAVWAYRAIVRRLRPELERGDVSVTVVSASPFHAFHGWTGEVLSGLVRYERTRTSLVDLMPLATVVHGRVSGVDLYGRELILTQEGRSTRIPYDQLLVGVGSRDATHRIPGLAAHGWSVKSDAGLLAMRNHLGSSVAQAAATTDRAERERLLTFVVAGGGFAGVEMTAAICERLASLRQDHPTLDQSPPRVVLVHGGDALLPEMHSRYGRIVKYATRQLERYGVELKLETRLERVAAGGAVLSDGSVIPSATVLSTIGQAHVPLPGCEGILRTTDGRIDTDAWFRTSEPNVWAGGDAAAVPHVMSGTPCPSNALWAIKHGRRVGDNIARAVTGKRLRRFTFLGLGQAASLGVGKGAVELYGVQLTGWVGWIARWGFFHYFMPSRRVAMQTIGEWLTLPLRGRLQPVRAVGYATRAAALVALFTLRPR